MEKRVRNIFSTNGRNTTINNLKKNIYISYLGQVVSVITGFLLSVVIVRNLEIQEFGEYSFLASAIVVLGIITNFGLEGVLERYVSEFLTKKKYGKVNNLIIITVLIRFIALIILVFCLFFFYEYLKNIFALTLGLTSFTVFLGILCTVKIKNLLGPALLAAYLQIYKEKINFIFYRISKLIAFSYVVKNGFGLKEILIAWLIVELFSLSHFIYIILKKIRANENKVFLEPFTKNDTNKIFNFGKSQAFGVVLFIFADIAVDNVMIGYFIDQEAVAIYAFAMAILMLVSTVNPLIIFQGTFGSIFTRLYTRNNSLAQIKDYYIIIVKIGFVVTIPLFTILAINLENIIRIIYSEKYLVAMPLIYLGILFMVIRSVTFAFTPLIMALEKNKLFVQAGVFSIYNLVGNLIFIPLFGTVGALIATGSAGIMIFTFYLFQFKKVFQSAYFPWLNFFQIILFCLPLVIMGIILNQYIQSIYSLFSAIILELLLYCLTLYCFKVFTIKERKMINIQMRNNLIKKLK